MKKEYDFSKGIQGKYYKKAMHGTNVILLDQDLVQSFPDSKTVNSTLREVLRLTLIATGKKPAARKKFLWFEALIAPGFDKLSPAPWAALRLRTIQVLGRSAYRPIVGRASLANHPGSGLIPLIPAVSAH